jgi:hypothetical protein
MTMRLVRATAPVPWRHAVPSWRWSYRAALAWFAPAGALTAYVVVLSARASEFSTATFLYSDAPESAYLGAGIAAGHPVTLPPHSEAVPILLSGWLFGLPAGHALVQALAAAPALAAVGLICAGLRRLGGSWPVALVVGLATGPIALWDDLWPTAHAFTLFALAVVAIVIIRRSSGPLRRPEAILATLVVGVTLIDDPTFLFSGVVPLVVAAAVVHRLRRTRRPLLATLVPLVASLAVAAITLVALRLDGVHILFTSKAPSGGLDVSRVPIAVALAVHGMATLVTGGWYGALLPQPLDALALCAGGLVLLAAPLVLWRTLRRRRNVAVADPVIAYCAFWAAVDVCVIGAYLLLGLSESPESAHYLIPCLMAAVATLPLLATGARSTAAVRAVAACVAAIATLGVAFLPATAFAGEQRPLDAQRTLALLSAQHLTRGFADYWVSNPLTWLSDGRVRVYPITERCGPNPAAICDYEFSDATWYQPGSGPTFLILRRDDQCVHDDPGSVLGTPARVISVDPQTTILVYGYDIAARFRPATSESCFP